MKTKAVALILFACQVVFVAGCGGGGGGGAPAAPPSNPSSPAPTQSNWSPAKNAFANSAVFNLTFNTNAAASCRWALTDSAHSAMTANCSGAGSTSHSCAVSGLADGARTIYLACSGAGGAADTAATNTHVPLTIDTVPPSIQITAPANGSSWFTSEPPTVVSVAYSDDRSGADPAALDVKFTLLNRELSITDLFGRDSVANASTSRTDPANNSPLSRTSAARFDSTALAVPARVWTIDRCGGGANQRASASGSDFPVLFWDTQCSKVWALTGANADASAITASGAVVSAAAAPELSVVFVAVAGSSTLRAYSISTGALAASIALPDIPTALSYNAANGRLYIAYDSRPEIGVYIPATGTLSSPIPVSAQPTHLRAWPTAAGDVVFAAWDVVYRLFRVNSAGTVLAAADIGAQLPRGLALSATHNNAFAPRRAEGDVRAVNVETSAAASITVGSLPSSIFDAGAEVIVLNAGDSTASAINAATNAVSRTVPLTAPASGGAYASGYFFLIEDLWQISPSATLTIQASIRDRAGNSSSATISITVQPETPGMARAADAY